MNERNNKLELLGSAPIPKALMALGIPIMIGMLINALYNLVDAYFVSGLGKSQMGAISVVFPLGQVVVGLGLMFGNGAASYLSRLLGRGDKDTADKVASTALYSSILIGAIIILLSTIFLKPILVMLGATETIMPYALTYARIYVLSCIFNVFNVTMNNIVSSEGAAKTTIWSTSFCLVVGLVMAVFSTQIISQFTEGDTQMILAGQKSLFANGITFILFGFYTVYSSLFLALGKGAAGFFLGACRQGVCFVPVILLLPMVWGMNGILYAQPIADVISVVITVFMALHLHRELSMAEKQVMSNSEI